MTAFTWVGWSIWFYLWRPAVTIVLWGMGLEIAQRQWIDLSGWTGLVDFAYHVMPFGWALCAMLLIWASVNYFRFHGKERRKARPAPSVESDAAWTQMTPAALAAGRGMKDLVCIHDEHGILIRLEPRFSEERAATATPARRHPASTSPALAEVRQQAPAAHHSSSAVRTPPDDSAGDSDLAANQIEEISS